MAAVVPDAAIEGVHPVAEANQSTVVAADPRPPRERDVDHPVPDGVHERSKRLGARCRGQGDDADDQRRRAHRPRHLMISSRKAWARGSYLAFWPIQKIACFLSSLFGSFLAIAINLSSAADSRRCE